MGLRKGWRASQKDIFRQNLKESVEVDDMWTKIDGISEVLSTHAKEHGQVERRRHPEHDDDSALLISRRRLERDQSRRMEPNFRVHVRRAQLKRERFDHLRQRALSSGSLGGWRGSIRAPHTMPATSFEGERDPEL